MQKLPVPQLRQVVIALAMAMCCPTMAPAQAANNSGPPGTPHAREGGVVSTGQKITPTAARGALFQSLNPDLSPPHSQSSPLVERVSGATRRTSSADTRFGRAALNRTTGNQRLAESIIKRASKIGLLLKRSWTAFFCKKYVTKLLLHT